MNQNIVVAVGCERFASSGYFYFAKEFDMENWLTVKEVAPMVKMSEQALYAAIREKTFPALRIGRRIRIVPSAIESWSQSQLNSSGEIEKG
jgi:excisionase family DNA binding protein